MYVTRLQPPPVILRLYNFAHSVVVFCHSLGSARHSTAKGSIFISMEDETDIANVIVTSHRSTAGTESWTRSRFLLAKGPLQNQDNIIQPRPNRTCWTKYLCTAKTSL
jgi:DNA polymerase III alpha subunit